MSDILKIIEEIDNQRFCFGDWETDLSALARGASYNDSRLVEYIRKLEKLVEQVKHINNIE